MVVMRRHRICVVETSPLPLPVRAQAVAPHLAETSAPAVFGADRALRDGDDDVAIIDESERMLTAAELFAAAFTAGADDHGPARRASARRTTVAAPRLQLWGASTSGIPRRGSRCVRLFHEPPETLIDRVLRTGAVGASLQLEMLGREQAGAGSAVEFTVPGTLVGAFQLRRSTVRVSLRITRFNPLFSVAELTLVSRRHPRRFFSAAHAALGFLAREP